MSRKLPIILVALLITAAAVALLLWRGLLPWRQLGPAQDAGVTVLAERLQAPWALALLPDGGIILTERPGRLRLVTPDGLLQADPLLTISDVEAAGEGGLLGLALHPQFLENGLFYIYYTYRSGDAANKVVRLQYSGGHPTVDGTIIEDIPGAVNHNGGRLRFGPDGKLYITTGDALDAALAQDVASLAGKILRLNEDGTVPADNPFPGSPVYSLGHRNPQGLAWDDLGRLWATEHGQSAQDEVNLIEPGRNYGWPDSRGDQQTPGTQGPLLHSGSATWAPSGMAFLDGHLYFAGLRSQSLFRLDPDNPADSLTPLLQGGLGRLRDVAAGPDGMLYVLTSNRDGRAVPSRGDDHMVRLDPTRLGA